MNENEMAENRRRWARKHYRRARISWRLAGAGSWRGGWLSDVSTSGVGLRISQGKLPNADQEIEVRFRSDARPIPYRVARAEVRQGVLGCRIASVQNRRGEARNCFTEAPVSWRNVGKGQWREGRLVDASPSGLALLVHAAPPRAGDQIELARKGTGQRSRCRVLRTETRRDSRVAVACRMVSSDQCQAWLTAQVGPYPIISQAISRVKYVA